MSKNEEFLTDLDASDSFSTYSDAFMDPDILKTFFDEISPIMILVNKEGKIEDINKTAAIALSKNNKNGIGLLVGELFKCVNSIKGNGCGKNRKCPECTIRNSIMHTFETHENIHKTESKFDIVANDESRTFHFLISTRLLQRNNESIVLLIAYDITEQTLFKKTIKENEMKYKELVDSLHQAIFETDLQGNLIFVSRFAFEMFGYVQEDFDKGINIFQTLIPEDLERAKLNFKGDICGNNLVSNEYTALRKDGSKFPIEIYASKIVHMGKVIGIRGILVDITERKEKENDLNESEALFRELFENMKDGVAIYEAVDKGLNFVFKNFNKASERIEVIGRDEVIGKRVTEVFPGVKDCGILDVFQRVWKTGNPEYYPITEYKDERIVGWRENFVCKMPSGEIVAIYSDVTMYKQAEEAIINAKVAAEDANMAKSEFIMNMSHEVRTPLNSIIGFSHVLLEKSGNLNEDQAHYLKTILLNGNHLLDIFNAILAISKIENGKINFHPEKLLIRDLINEVVASIESFACEKDIILSQNIDLENNVLKGDRFKIKQALYNLVHNAIKFTPHGGQVTIETKKYGRSICFFVKDTGIGISPNDHSELFNQFYQVDSTTTRNYDGVGLGLNIVKKFVKLHNGEVWVESELDKGSTFGFSIPINPKAHPFD